MRKLAALTALTFLMSAGCTGMVGDPDVEITTIHLYADNLGALLATECVQMHKEDGCSRYPNPNECDVMEIVVKGDGSTRAVCKNKGKVTTEFKGGVADGLPILCHATKDALCQQCVDIYGNNVYDNCTRGAAMFRARGGGWGNGLPEGSGWLGTPGDNSTPPGNTTPPGNNGNPPTDPPKKEDPPKDKTNPPETPTPPAGSGNKCDPKEARKKYAEELNKILKQEGLGFVYKPDLTKDYNSKSGYWGYGGYNNKGDMCKYWLSSNSKLTKCWNPIPGKCHCMGGLFGSNKTCRCARINVFALRKVCLSIPADCDYKSWVANIVMEYGVATKWLFSGTYSKGYYSGLPSNPNNPPPAKTLKCLGSPIVLDMADDGVKPSSVKQGVKFDLMGHGAMDTAWIKGDDALLVMDRNRNGVVDDGTELFGSATDIGGAPAADGFEALAMLDTNGNGIVERGDLLFDELKLWRDANRDGLSQKGELKDLTSAGVIGMEIQYNSDGPRLDEHGNDVSMRASFIRADGRKGLMVDVLFGIGK